MSETRAIAVFGGGCFWCTEAIFRMLRGVVSVTPGYAGGTTEHPSYEAVSGGGTGHAEVIRIEYDPTRISYTNLLEVFFASHDPTTADRQGDDIGTQYRSIILTTNDQEQEDATTFIAKLNASHGNGNPIVTEVVPITEFYSAEEYHKDYFHNNPNEGYCKLVIDPKLEILRKKFSSLVSDNTSPQ
jgi:peptide-methionine (S)-S-oxide reductase